MKLLGALVMVACALQAQTPDLKSASAYPKMVQKQVTAWIEGAAQKMPEEEYAFKPDAAVRTFGQILGHIADADYTFCSAVLGENNPSPGIENQDDESGTNVGTARCLRLLQSGLRYAHRRRRQ